MFFVFYSDVEIHLHGMDKTSSTNRERRNDYRVLVRKPERKKLHGKSWFRRKR